MKKLIVALCALVTILPATAAAARNDFVTGNGSLRAGLHKGKMYAVLTANDTDVVLEPDVFASDDENKAWTAWLSDFDNALFTNWTNAGAQAGQQTVWVVVKRDGDTWRLSMEPGTFFDGTAGGDPAAATKFDEALMAALDKTAKSMPAPPPTKNPFREIRYAMTFMDADKMLPLKAPEQLGFLAVIDDKGQVVAYGRQLQGQGPGIQIISDDDKGKIEAPENDKFLELLKQYGMAPN
jgi:hypothetical protein